MKNKTLVPNLITLICSVVLVIAFFLPFASTVGSLREYFKKTPDNVMIDIPQLEDPYNELLDKIPPIINKIRITRFILSNVGEEELSNLENIYNKFPDIAYDSNLPNMKGKELAKLDNFYNEFLEIFPGIADESNFVLPSIYEIDLTKLRSTYNELFYTYPDIAGDSFINLMDVEGINISQLENIHNELAEKYSVIDIRKRITNGSMVNLSLYEIGSLNYDYGWGFGLGALWFFTVLMAAFTFVDRLTAVVLVFDLFNVGVYISQFIRFFSPIFSLTEITYMPGAAFYIYLIITAAVLIGCIWQLSLKMKKKKSFGNIT